MARTSHRDVLCNTIKSFQQRSIGLATGESVTYQEWEEARAELLSQPELLRVLPDWVASTRWGGQFWQLMKSTSRTYAGRREFIWSTLAAAFELAEKGARLPVSSSLEPLLQTCTSAAVADAWERIHVRHDSDPEGTITAARSLLESACKYVLDQLGVAYDDNEDLPQLYGKAAAAMSLGPKSHKESVFKQILGGCFSAVSGLAALRNAFGDAHGKGTSHPRPSARHADLAVNLGGTISSFLIATYEERFRNKA